MIRDNGHHPPALPLAPPLIAVRTDDLREVVDLATAVLDSQPYQPGAAGRYSAVNRLRAALTEGGSS